MTGEIAAPLALRESRDWHSLVNQMSYVQRLVHLAFRQVDADVREWRNQLFGVMRAAFAEAIQAEIVAVGCPNPGRIVVREGAELRIIAHRAQTVAEGIVNTYNYDLAHEILRIGEEVRTANRNTYTARLYRWDAARKGWKYAQIAETETAWAINMGKDAFHTYNSDIPAQAEVVPNKTQCPICAEYVRGNPYPSMAELYRRCILPAHPYCPHHGRVIPSGKPSPETCRQLWRG